MRRLRIATRGSTLALTQAGTVARAIAAAAPGVAVELLPVRTSGDAPGSRGGDKLRFEPPRFCAQCDRRMVVQVTPTSWTARCVEHGELSSS